jgi:hypothetical protein
MALATTEKIKRPSKSKKGFAVDDFLIVVPKSELNPETGTISATDVIE